MNKWTYTDPAGWGAELDETDLATMVDRRMHIEAGKTWDGGPAMIGFLVYHAKSMENDLVRPLMSVQWDFIISNPPPRGWTPVLAVSIYGKTTEQVMFGLRRGLNGYSRFSKARTWFIPGCQPLTIQKLDELVSDARPDIIRTLDQCGEACLGLRYRLIGQPVGWHLVVKHVMSAPSIILNREDNHNSTMEKLTARLDRERKPVVGYVTGNRHNYLFELCQAFKEAGYPKQKAKHEIEQWARKHRDDEERGYIADLVYGDETDVMTERVHECKECWRKWLARLD